MSEGPSADAVAALLKQVNAPEQAAARLGSSLAAGALSPAERAVAQEVLRGMLAGAALRVREVLADTLKRSPHLPHDIALSLAQDVESVALPVLEFSQVLSDADLISVIQAGSPAKQEAIAGRETVSGEVAGALIDTDNGNAVARLAGNAGAALDEQLLERAATRFASDGRVVEKLSRRPDLPVELAERMVHFTAETLSAYILRRADLPEQVVTQIVLKTREQVTVDLRAPHMPHEEAVALAHHLARCGRLTAPLMLRALCVGDVGLFEAGLAELANIPVHNARLLLHDPGKAGFKALYQRSGLPPAQFDAYDVAFQVAGETNFDGGKYDRERYRRRMIERILTQFERLPEDDLDYLLIRLSDIMPSTEARTALMG